MSMSPTVTGSATTRGCESAERDGTAHEQATQVQPERSAAESQRRSVGSCIPRQKTHRTRVACTRRASTAQSSRSSWRRRSSPRSEWRRGLSRQRRAACTTPARTGSRSPTAGTCLRPDREQGGKEARAEVSAGRRGGDQEARDARVGVPDVFGRTPRQAGGRAYRVRVAVG